MKILQIAPPWVNTPPKNYGGTEWVIANLIKGLADLGEDVTLFATKASKVKAKVKCIFRKPLVEQNISWTAALPALIHYQQAFKDAQNYDLIHAHLSSETDLILLPILADLTDKGIPNLLTIHSPFPFDHFSRMDKFFLKLYAGKILAVNISKIMHKIRPKQFRDGGFVHNSLDITKMKFNPKGGQYLTWVGRIIREKGTAEAIKIAKMAGEQIIFAGIVDKYSPESVTYWEKEVKPLIDGHQIQYVGPVDLKLKNKLLGGAKAFLNPIHWKEPFGMVMVESMACGTPVISYDNGAPREVIKHGKSGFLASNSDEMINFLDKAKKLSRYECRQHVERNFSPKAAAKKYLKIYQQEILFHQPKVINRVVPSVSIYSSHLRPAF